MRDLIVTENITPDGLIEASEGFPVVLGCGRRLVEGATDVGALRLAEARSFRSGVALMRDRTA